MLDPELLRTIRAKTKGKNGRHQDIMFDGLVCEVFIAYGKLVEVGIRYPDGQKEWFRYENKRWRKMEWME